MIPKWMNSFSVVEGMLSRFQPTATASAIGHVYQAHFVVQAEKGNAFRTSRQVSENSESFKKLDPGTQFQWEQISSNVQLHCSLRGSEAEPTTSSRYSSFQGCERSLDPRRLQRAVQHLRTNSASPKGWHRPSALGSDLRRGKVRLAFSLHTASPVKDWPKYASLSASQWLSRSVMCTLDTDLPTDHRPCTSPEQSGEGSLKCQPTCLRQRKYSQLVKDQGEDVHGTRLHPAL